jgi:hypothetical protein
MALVLVNLFIISYYIPSSVMLYFRRRSLKRTTAKNIAGHMIDKSINHLKNIAISPKTATRIAFLKKSRLSLFHLLLFYEY